MNPSLGNGHGDRTRWNRAGLRRFRYVQGNAAEYLESVREGFTNALGPNLWRPGQTGQDVDELARLRRVLDQYQGPRCDYAWEIARVFARACHVLSETIDAHANEGYLETATQWDLLRRLVGMLGYAPAPPASASTVLALLAKPGAAGQVERGFQVKFSPLDNSAPVVFETLADIDVVDDLNFLRPVRWNRSEDNTFAPFENETWCKTPEMALSTGQLALLWLHGPTFALPEAPKVGADIRIVDLKQVDQETGRLTIGDSTTDRVSLDGWFRGYTELLVGPKKVLRPRLNGPHLLQLDRGNAPSTGDVVAWMEGHAWQFARVAAAEGPRFRLEKGKMPSGPLYPATQVAAVQQAEPEYRVPPNSKAVAAQDRQGGLRTLSLDTTNGDFDSESTAPAKQGYRVLKDSASAKDKPLFIVSAVAVALGSVEAAAPTVGYVFDGAPTELKSDDWMIAEYADGDGITFRRAKRIASIAVREADYTLVLQDGEQAAASPAPPAAPPALIMQLRRVEAILDQPIFDRLHLKDLVNGTLGQLSPGVIEGVGALGARTPSYADTLAKAGVPTVASLAVLSPGAEISSIPITWLREFRTRAEHLMHLPAELPPAGALLGWRLKDILALESQPQPAPVPAHDMGDAALLRVYGPFRYVLRPAGYDRNDVPLPDCQRLTLTLRFSEVPLALKPGRLVLIEQQGGDPHATHLTTIRSITERGDTGQGESYAVIELDEPVPANMGFTLGNTVIHANAVAAGHGETKAERVLGSGNGAMLNQEFVFDVPGASSIADSTLPSGVRADIELRVDEQTWRQVASLADSGRADCHYTVRMTEAGALRIVFGDGQHGRRLPTGVNNVRIRYRLGVGLSGNLPAYCLERPAKPHRLVDSVRQPLAAQGGGDMESVDLVRANAPASLLTLERAVSLDDYANLAVSQTKIWQARAFARPAGPGRRDCIEVVIVPAGGAPLGEDRKARISIGLMEEQRQFLVDHAPAGVDVNVSPFEPLLIDLEIRVFVKSAEFDPRSVADAVRTVVTSAFGLQGRRLGQPLQRAELYKIVEDIKGVEYSECIIRLAGGSEAIPTIVPTERQVVYLHERISTLRVVAGEYVL